MADQVAAPAFRFHQPWKPPRSPPTGNVSSSPRRLEGLLAALIALSGSATAAPSAPSGMLFGDDFVYLLKAPPGWVLDNKSGVRDGTHAVFYREGGSWKQSPAVMYTNTDRLKDSPSLDAYIDQYLEEFRKKNGPGLKVHKAPSVKTDDGKWAQVVELTGDRWSNFESLAFILDGKLVVFVVLTSRTEGDYRQSLASFGSLVGSYKFLGRSLAELTDVAQIVSIAQFNASTPQGASYDREIGEYFATWYQETVAKCVGKSSSLAGSKD